MSYSITAILKKMIEEEVPDLRLRNAVFLDYLQRRGRVKQGDHTDLYWNAIATGSQTATAAMTVAGADQTTGDSVQASLGIGQYKVYHQFTVSMVDLLNAKTAGVGKLNNLFRQNIQGGLLAIRRQLNIYLWTADGTAPFGGMVGLAPILDPALTYANINPVTYTQWVPILETAGAPRALTRNIMYNYSRMLEEQEQYDEVLMTTPAMAQTYNTLFDSVAGINSVAGFGQSTDLGYAARSYNGIPLMTDPQMPTGQIVGFKPDDVCLFSLNLANADGEQIAAFGLKNNLSSIASVDVGGLQINIALLPQSNPGLITVQLFVLPQLKVHNRRSVHGIMKLT